MTDQLLAASTVAAPGAVSGAPALMTVKGAPGVPVPDTAGRRPVCAPGAGAAISGAGGVGTGDLTVTG
ncbi:hypothetical protein ACWCZ5_03600 [Streptomyces sp. NPDC001667]